MYQGRVFQFAAHFLNLNWISRDTTASSVNLAQFFSFIWG